MPMLRTDPDSRCAILMLPNNSMAVLPVLGDGADDVDFEIEEGGKDRRSVHAPMEITQSMSLTIFPFMILQRGSVRSQLCCRPVNDRPSHTERAGRLLPAWLPLADDRHPVPDHAFVGKVSSTRPHLSMSSCGY